LKMIRNKPISCNERLVECINFNTDLDVMTAIS